jgi:hypothetical protein
LITADWIIKWAIFMQRGILFSNENAWPKTLLISIDESHKRADEQKEAGVVLYVPCASMSTRECPRGSSFWSKRGLSGYLQFAKM